jgi:asparagine synthase (glutamine-hydrolysing)
MCGIVGIVSKNNKLPVDRDLLQRMRDTMIHRGPDGAGIWISENHMVGLAHRRLSIIDLSPSAVQPMSNEDNQIWITFNGEIYNHQEIRNELLKTGNHQWKTHHSDTEVIIHAYEEWGIDFIQKLRGQFAIALWDNIKQELYLFRDRAGIKPLYYTYSDGRLMFASEIKAIIEDHSVKRKVNEESFFHYLTFLTTPAPDTLFENIHKIPSGSYVKYSMDEGIKVITYYDILDHINPLVSMSEADITSVLIEKLRDAVKTHKMSDVPVGVFLSGGIDSSTNAALFSEGQNEAVKTFTIGYDKNYDSYQNETHYAKMMAGTIGAEYFEKLLAIDDLIDFLPKMVHLQDEPLADPVCVPVYYVSKLAKDNNVTVCQVGEGADELFCGYPGWANAIKNNDNLNGYPTFLKKIAYTALSRSKFKHSSKTELLRRNISDQPIFWSGAELASDSIKKQLLSDRLKKTFKGHTSWDAISPYYKNFIDKAPDTSFMNWMSYIDLKFRLPELLLMRVDKMSMGVSIETRVPFLDHLFVEFAMSIPPEFKFKDGSLKHILKESVRGVIPDELIDRKKQGFGVPVNDWLFQKLGDKISAETNSFLKKTDLFDSKELTKIISNKDSRSWSVLNFIMWYNEYID